MLANNKHANKNESKLIKKKKKSKKSEEPYCNLGKIRNKVS